MCTLINKVVYVTAEYILVHTLTWKNFTGIHQVKLCTYRYILKKGKHVLISTAGCRTEDLLHASWHSILLAIMVDTLTRMSLEYLLAGVRRPAQVQPLLQLKP